jgi:hypothetical protein
VAEDVPLSRGAGPVSWRSDWQTDKIVDVCADLQEDLPRAKRALVAARRSGRDRMFNAHVAFRRIQLHGVRVATPLLDWLTARLSRA